MTGAPLPSAGIPSANIPNPNIPSTMVALRKSHDSPGLWLHDFTPLPRLGPRDCLIAVTHAGICGTDRHIYEWDAWSRNRVKVGITTGHEFVGKVVARGSAARRFSPGDRVSAEGHIACGYCRACRTGNAHICDTVEIIGIDRNGCFAQYIAIPEENIWPVDDRIPDEVAAIFDPLGNAMHTVMAAGVSGKSVLITGVGVIGLMAVNIARAAGASRIFVTDVDPGRLEIARQLGADEAYLSTDGDWVEHVRDATHHAGPDVLLEMSGHPAAIAQGLAAIRNGGVAAMLGLPAADVSLNLARDVIFKGITIIGVTGRKMFETWYQVQDFVLSGKLDFDKIITHQIPLSDFQRGFEMMQSGEAIKVVMNIPGEPNLCPTNSLTSEATTYLPN